VRCHRPKRRAQVVFGGHVHDGVVDEHGVEGAPQPHVAHVAFQVFALGLSLRLFSRIPSACSTRIMEKERFMCQALFPPPLPSSSTSRPGRRAEERIISTYNVASSAYSAGGDMTGHQPAMSL
jgi:hypothetical protein